LANDRSGGTTCFYWSGSVCVANSYFVTTLISCYNNGGCDGNGTCADCSKYIYGGLKFGNLSYSDASRTDDSTSASYSQTPMDVAMYNVRAYTQKCCNWSGAPVSFSVGTGGALSAVTTKCTKTAAADFQKPWYYGSANRNKFPCNGAKSDCPYYTGPKFQYVVDSKMDRGDKISVAQILELRYYSRDWTKYSNPRAEYEKSFAEPDIYAWTGDFDDAKLLPNGSLSGVPSETSIPRVCKSTLFASDSDASSFDSSLSLGVPIVASTGTTVKGRTPNYPTLIRELSSTISLLEIRWPYKATKAIPYVFPTFRIGTNQAYIIVVTSSPYPIYAVNLTKHPQVSTLTDEAFISYMSTTYPDDLYTADTSEESSSIGTVFVVDLEYAPELNEIKIFTANGSSTGSMYTDTTYIQHKFYHAHLAQTSFRDKYGQAVVEPWIDRFVWFTANVSVKALSVNVATPTEALWDSVAYNKSTLYPIEKVETEYPTEWNALYCDVLAITLDNKNINPVQSWKVSGKPTCLQYASTNLGIWIDRSSNPNLSDTDSSEVEMSVVARSTTGQYFPSNVIFVSPKTAGSYGFDKKYDVVRVVFAYTEYKQGPVVQADVKYLKYPSYYSTTPSSNKYIDIMPYKIDFNATAGTVGIEGLLIPIYDDSGTLVDRLGIEDFESVLSSVEKSTVDNELLALNSFATGGATESSIAYLGTQYATKVAEFNSKYDRYVFGDGDSVTLSHLCEKLEYAGYYEGTQEYRVVFEDSTGRPIGVKRTYLLMQSAVPSCRDVEIYYKWKSKRGYVDPVDHASLLARDYKPLKASTNYTDIYYIPDCGDHALQDSTSTFYTKFVSTDESISWTKTTEGDLAKYDLDPGDKGPMWYPYKACSTPYYYESDPMTKYLLCAAPVEGMGNGKRRDYWERMRSSDLWTTVRLGMQLDIGCTWSWVEGDYKMWGAPVFAGFTRARSGHLFAPYQTDREAIRISRHYIKRNIAIENEIVRSEGQNGLTSLSTEASAELFYGDGSPKTDEKPIWIHLMDGISTVNRTSPTAQHPFSNITMDTEGDTDIDEAFSSTRLAMKDVFEHRDLIRADGNLVYNPSEPKFQDTLDEATLATGTDIYWVYKEDSTYWAWLEHLKDPVRATGGSRVPGVFLYNPSVIAWKKDMTPATQTLEGTYDLVYTAPTFNKTTGLVKTNPTISWAGGPPREIDWYTGTLGTAPTSWTGGKDPYDEANYDSSDGYTFMLFGKGLTTSSGSTINGFLADNTGLHQFEDGDTKYKTFRGLGVRPTFSISSLPYTNIDIMASNTSVLDSVLALTTVYTDKTYDISTGGYKFVNNMTIDYYAGTDGDKSYYFPQVVVDGQLATGVWLPAIFYFSINASTAAYSSGSQTVSVSPLIASSRFAKLRMRIEKTPQKRFVRITNITLYIKDPTSSTESVQVYEQKVNISSGYTGTRKHSDLYYFYGRTFPDFGLNDVIYDEAGTTGQSQDLKWTGRTVRDIILMYYFTDPTGTLFDFPNSAIASIDDIVQSDGGPYYIEGPLSIYTKGQTVVTSSHVTDPIDSYASGESWSYVVSPDECSACANIKSESTLDEALQECLYKEAADLYGKNFVSSFSSFWHPDETSFFVDEVGLSEMPSWTLALTSYISSFNKVMRHTNYGCDASVTNEYYDGKIHKISQWAGLGHILYLGSPVWNWTCFAIIMNKKGKHLGEDYFETYPSKYVESKSWPPSEITNVQIESPSFYSSNSAYWDNPATYTGGSLAYGFPMTVSQALNYAPDGYPRNFAEELLNFPLTKSWPLGDTDIVDGYRKFSKST
jgi:hypothetical protein